MTASGRTTRKRKREREWEGEDEARQRAADRSLARMGVVDEADPRARADRREPLIGAEAREPGNDLAGRNSGAAKRVAVAGEPLREQHAEERHEEGAEQIEEVLVVDEVEDERAGGRDDRDPEDEQPLRHPRQDVLDRDGGRVDVRERLLRLVDTERDERERRPAPPAAIAVITDGASDRPRVSSRIAPRSPAASTNAGLSAAT